MAAAQESTVLRRQHVLQKAERRRVDDAGEGQGDHATPQQSDAIREAGSGSNWSSR